MYLRLSIQWISSFYADFVPVNCLLCSAWNLHDPDIQDAATVGLTACSSSAPDQEKRCSSSQFVSRDRIGSGPRVGPGPADEG
jgi:hypothetical protein